MSFRNTAILFVLVALLGGYLYFVERPAVEKESERKTLISFDSKQVARISITTADSVVELERRAGKWWITKPRELEADPAAVDAILRAVTGAERKRVVDEKPASLAPFGLDKPAATIEIGLEGGTALPAIQVGKTTPIGGNAYARRGDEAAVVLTAGTLEAALKKKVDDLRDKTILEFTDGDVKSISIESPDGKRTTLSHEGEAWKLVEPLAAPADPTQARSLLATLRSLRARGFVDEPRPEDAATYGLDPAKLRVTVALEETGVEKRLLLGNDTPEKDKQEIYAKLDGKEVLYTVGSHVLKNLAKGPNDLRDKTVLTIDRDVITRITVSASGGAPFTIERDEGEDSWAIAKATKPIDETLLKRFVDDIVQLHGDGISSDSGTLGEGGLPAPAITIDLQTKDGKPLGEILLAQQGDKHYAAADGSKTIYTIADYVYRRFDKKEADFERENAAEDDSGADDGPPGEQPFLRVQPGDGEPAPDAPPPH